MPPTAAGVAVAALLVLPATAPAADLPEPPSSEDGYLQIGAFHVRPDVALKNLGYDSNVFFSNDKEVGDYTYTVAPAIDAVMLFGHRGRLDLSESIDIVRFVSTPSQNHLDSDTKIGWQTLFSDFLYEGGVGFNTAKIRPNDEITERTRLQQRHAYGAMTWSRTDNAALTARVDANNLDYSDDLQAGVRLSDLSRDDVLATVGGRVHILPKTSLALDIGYEEHLFDDATLGRDSTGLRIVPGLIFDDTAFVQGEIHVGLLDLTPDSSQRADYNGLVAAATLSKTVGSRLRFIVKANRDLNVSIFGNNLYYVAQLTDLTMYTSISTRFRLEAGGSFGRNIYPEVATSGGFTGRRRDSLHTTWLGGSYAMSGAPRIGLRVQFRERTSNFVEENFDNIRVVGNATYTF
ncbi:MAG: outer membrane beta-barrel protein [Acidobacteriota bacterium]